MGNVKRILFVCTGNTCRSYMAEKIAREYLQNKDSTNSIDIISAGTGCMDGEPASGYARTVLAEFGYKDLDHKARELSEELIKSADLILTMTKNHKKQVLRNFPQAESKVFLLKEYVYSKNGLDELKNQARNLYDILECKKREIFKKYQNEIESLEARREKLLKEQEELDEQLRRYEEMIAGAAGEEQRELAEIEKKLRDLDVADPFGLPLEHYRSCGNELREFVENAVNQVLGDGKSK